MQSKANGAPKRPYRIVVYAGMAITALWLLAYLMPAGRTVMLDASLAFVLGLMATGLLGWAAYQGIYPRRFWGWLVAAWTTGLMGSAVWGIYQVMTGQPLPYISLVDVLYLVRYALILIAFWRCLGVPAGQQWISLLLLLLLVAAVVFGAFFLAVPASRQTIFWLAGAAYPILDMGLMYVALEARKQEPAGTLRNALGFLTLALVSYGAANWLNFFGQAIPFEAVTGVSHLFWPLSDILAGVAVLCLFWSASAPARAKADDSREEPAQP
jgi:hypothetical protein